MMHAFGLAAGDAVAGLSHHGTSQAGRTAFFWCASSRAPNSTLVPHQNGWHGISLSAMCILVPWRRIFNAHACLGPTCRVQVSAVRPVRRSPATSQRCPLRSTTVTLARAACCLAQLMQTTTVSPAETARYQETLSLPADAKTAEHTIPTAHPRARVNNWLARPRTRLSAIK